MRLLGFCRRRSHLTASPAEPAPPPGMEVFRGMAEALANRDADAFLDQFDPQMPQYEKLRDEIQELFGAGAGDRIDHRRDHATKATIRSGRWSWTGC